MPQAPNEAHRPGSGRVFIRAPTLCVCVSRSDSRCSELLGISRDFQIVHAPKLIYIHIYIYIYTHIHIVVEKAFREATMQIARGIRSPHREALYATAELSPAEYAITPVIIRSYKYTITIIIIHMYTYMYIYICIHIYTYTYAYVYIYIYIS